MGYVQYTGLWILKLFFSFILNDHQAYHNKLSLQYRFLIWRYVLLFVI